MDNSVYSMKVEDQRLPNKVNSYYITNQQVFGGYQNKSTHRATVDKIAKIHEFKIHTNELKIEHISF